MCRNLESKQSVVWQIHYSIDKIVEYLSISYLHITCYDIRIVLRLKIFLPSNKRVPCLRYKSSWIVPNNKINPDILDEVTVSRKQIFIPWLIQYSLMVSFGGQYFHDILDRDENLLAGVRWGFEIYFIENSLLISITFRLFWQDNLKMRSVCEKMFSHFIFN